MVNEQNQLDMILNEEFKLHLKAIRPIEVLISSSDFFLFTINFFWSHLADYRKWEAGRTEPIRHDAGYVSLSR